MLANHCLLEAWERGYGQPPHRQALTLLAARFPECPLESLLDLSVGQRDAHLLQLRRELFGSRLAAVVACPVCQEKMEVNLDLNQFLQAEQSAATSPVMSLADRRFRAPSVGDLLAVENVPAERRAAALFERCLIDESCERTEPAADLREQLAAAIGAADPHADIRLAMNCPACEHHWESAFDIVSVLWSEWNSACQRLLAEIHTLARTYGWSEREILELSPWRRQIYLNLVRQ